MPKITIDLHVPTAQLANLPDIRTNTSGTVTSLMAISGVAVMDIRRTDRTHGDDKPGD